MENKSIQMNKNGNLKEQVMSNHLFFIAALHHNNNDIYELLRILNKRLERLLKRRGFIKNYNIKKKEQEK